MTPEQQVAFFKGALAEVGVLEGRDYESVRWINRLGLEHGICITSWTCDDVVVGRAFELLAAAQGEFAPCAVCWADQEAEGDALDELCISKGHKSR